jgi:hypothetical protein
VMTFLQRVWPWVRRQPSAFSLPPNIEIGTGEPVDSEEAKRIFAEAKGQPIRECIPPTRSRRDGS